jgi:hypothetical protein
VTAALPGLRGVSRCQLRAGREETGGYSGAGVPAAATGSSSCTLRLQVTGGTRASSCRRTELVGSGWGLGDPMPEF